MKKTCRDGVGFQETVCHFKHARFKFLEGHLNGYSKEKVIFIDVYTLERTSEPKADEPTSATFRCVMWRCSKGGVGWEAWTLLLFVGFLNEDCSVWCLCLPNIHGLKPNLQWRDVRSCSHGRYLSPESVAPMNGIRVLERGPHHARTRKGGHLWTIK